MFGAGECSGSPVGGPTEEDPHCLADMGHTGDIAFTTAVTDAWCDTRHKAEAAVLDNQGWVWQMFSDFATPQQGECAATLRSLCAAGTSSTFYNATTYHRFTLADKSNPANLTYFDEDLATFMLLRGPYAWLGYGWIGCGVPYAFPDALKADYGEPTGLCSETAPNSCVFERQWSKATVQMDCNTYKGSITATRTA